MPPDFTVFRLMGEPGHGAQNGSADTVLLGLDAVAGSALRLIYFDGLTQVQTARALGLPRATVSRSVADGMRQLTDRLLRTAS